MCRRPLCIKYSSILAVERLRKIKKSSSRLLAKSVVRLYQVGRFLVRMNPPEQVFLSF